MPLKPVSVMWESTIACGLACKHCKASARAERDPRELSTEESYAFIDQIVAFGKPYPVLRITGGNALRREDIFDIIRYAKDSGLKVTIAPSTTPLLNRKNIERLKRAGCDVVAVSIDGATPEQHDSFRGMPGTFDRLVKATEIMRELNLPFRLLTTVTRHNVRELPEIMFLARRLGAIGWYLYMLIPTGRATEELALSPAEYEDVFHFVYDAMRLPLIVVNAIAGSEPYRRVAVMRRLVEEGMLEESALMQGELYSLLRRKLTKLAEEAGLEEAEVAETSYSPKDSSVFGKGIFVAHRGEIYPSSFMPVTLGNVREDVLKVVYTTSDVLKALHDATKLKGRCGVCEFNDICRGSRSRAYAVTGDYLAEDPYCAYIPGRVELPDVNKEAILNELRVTNFSRRVG
ncbi:MAG: TIGR04053 family radical SAM/SPASM domain-containing protein [Euryarchaeota archaeon]|nr:TIGR04053 family radical SAM/SPASM domain-containing protein [Euryarchaeota archaeon]